MAWVLLGDLLFLLDVGHGDAEADRVLVRRLERNGTASGGGRVIGAGEENATR